MKVGWCGLSCILPLGTTSSKRSMGKCCTQPINIGNLGIDHYECRPKLSSLLLLPGDRIRSVGIDPLESGRSTLQAALDLLKNVSKVSNYTGGGIEHKLPGIGWVICEDETECPDQDEDA